MTQRRDKGEGSWTQNTNRSWTLRLGYGTKSDGRRKTLTVTAPTKEECRVLMREKKREWDRQKETGVKLEHETLSGMCYRYTASKKMEDNSRDREECAIRNQIAKHPIGKLQIQSVKTKDVEKHILSLIESGLSSSSIDKALDIINAAYEWAIARRELEYNPVSAIKKEMQKSINKLDESESDEEDVIVLSREEQKRFVEEAVKQFKNVAKDKYCVGLYVLLLLYTGMRCGEMLSLRWSDVNFEDHILRIDSSLKTTLNRKKKVVNGVIPNHITEEGKTKNKKSRNIVLNEDAMNVLRLLKNKVPNAKGKDYIVLTRTGKHYTVREMDNRLKVIFRNAGMPQYGGSCHVLRRTFATNMIDDGIDTKVVAEYIGDLESTLKKHYFAARKKVETSTGEKIAVVNPWKKEKDSAE